MNLDGYNEQILTEGTVKFVITDLDFTSQQSLKGKEAMLANSQMHEFSAMQWEN